MAEKEMEFIDDFRQRHMEAFIKEVDNQRPRSDFNGLTDLPIAQYSGIAVRAAIRAGWYKNPLTAEEVADLPPRLVVKYGRAIIGKYNELTAIDPN